MNTKQIKAQLSRIFRNIIQTFYREFWSAANPRTLKVTSHQHKTRCDTVLPGDILIYRLLCIFSESHFSTSERNQPPEAFEWSPTSGQLFTSVEDPEQEFAGDR